MKNKISVIGSGNIAWHLSHALDKSGHVIDQVISRNELHAKELAEKFGAFYSNRLESVNPGVDVVLICVSDDQIESVVSGLPFTQAIVAHTCGSQPIDILSGPSKNTGIFYPLQSFSKTRKVDMLKVPFLLEASNNTSLRSLETLADSISNHVTFADSATRLKYHLSAVFANNFVNHLFDLADRFLSKNNLDFNVLKPIILETAAKVQDMTPRDAQTGPAKRGDRHTIEKHLELLKDDPKLAELYNFLSNNIGHFD